jgi:hypothetical protein
LLVLGGILRRALDGKKRRITWRLKETLEDNEYADDVRLISHRFEHMQRKLDDLWDESKKVVLAISSSKTKEIRVNTTVNQDLRLNSWDITSTKSSLPPTQGDSDKVAVVTNKYWGMQSCSWLRQCATRQKVVSRGKLNVTRFKQNC